MSPFQVQQDQFLSVDPRIARVLIVKSNLEPFRIEFFHALKDRLAGVGIELCVAVPHDRCGECTAPWLVPVRGGEIRLLNRTAHWQSVGHLAKDADLIIGQQSARELANYWLLAHRKRHGYRFALWGHGVEFQKKWSSPITELVKRNVFRNIDHWFAYTPGVARMVEQSGFKADRITAVYNSVNTRNEIAFHNAVTAEKKAQLRARLGLHPNALLVTYCGALYKAKRLDFLVEACTRVRANGADLHLAILGDGEERAALERAARSQRWIHLIGQLRGIEKATCLAASECMLLPGVVGLAVVDAFAHRCPLVTTDISGHGPEIEYLEDNVNGIISANDLGSYADAIQVLVANAAVRARLAEGCRRASEVVTLERMVENFAKGVERALSVPPRGGHPKAKS